MEPLALVFNDVHIKPTNTEAVLRAVSFMVDYAKKNNISEIIFIGDMFDSRKHQELSVLMAFKKILNMFEGSDMFLHLIAGNHDKTTYSSYESFLSIFDNYNDSKIYSDIDYIEIGNKKICLLPFFSEEILVEKIDNAEKSDILLSHFAMVGSEHLGHVNDSSNITRKKLNKFTKVYLGHYHNHNHIGKNITHLPSFLQNNFGEDEEKGFAVLNEDLSYTLIEGDFRRYKKVSIDIDKTTSKDISKLVNEHKNSNNVIRFEFTGSESKLRSIDKGIFIDTGIDVKVKYKKTYNLDNLTIPEIKEKHDKGSILENFETFCDEKDYDVKDGRKMLLEFLNKK